MGSSGRAGCLEGVFLYSVSGGGKTSARVPAYRQGGKDGAGVKSGRTKHERSDLGR